MQNLRMANNIHPNEDTTWRESTLEEVVDILDSKRIPVNSDERAKRQGTVPYYGATGQVGWIDDYLFNEEVVLLGEDGAPFLDKSKPIAYIVDGKSWVNNHAHVLRAKKGLANNWFIKYYLDYFNFEDFVGGTTRLKLNQSAMKNIPIRLPSLEEQNSLVGLLKVTIDAIEQNKSKLSKAKELVQQFRQSILTAATTGKLTEDWRQLNEDVEPATKILEKIKLQRKVKSKAPSNVIDIAELPTLPEKWIYSFFGDIVDDFKYGTSEKSDYLFEGTPVLRIPNVISQKIDIEDLKYLQEQETREEYLAKDGDILIVRSNGSRELVGKNALVKGLKGNYAFASYLIRIRPNAVLSEYMSILLNSHLVRQQLFSNAKSAAGINNINTQELASMVVPLPPIEEQKAIVEKVNQYFEVTSKVEWQIEKTEAKVLKLTQAILAKTFNSF